MGAHRVIVVALATIAGLAPGSPAAAHLGPEHADAPARAGGAGSLAAHARAHAAAHVMDERRADLTPAQRRRASAETAEATATLNESLTGARDDVGHWERRLYPLPEYAIHAIMLPTGKVLIFGREPTGPDGTRSNLGSARLFDPRTGTTTHVPPPAIAGVPAAIYCSGQALLSDGRVLIAGGNLSDPGPGRPEYGGLDYTFIFDPWSATWEVGPRMTHGRWYPTLTRLSSGDVLIAGGLDENGQGVRNGQLDILRPDQDLATSQTLQPYPAGSRADPDETNELLAPDARVGLSLYPFMFALPNGDVALAGPGQQDSALLATGPSLYDRNAAPGSAWTQIGDIDNIPIGGPAKIHQGGTAALDPDLGAFSGSWSVFLAGGADDAGSGFHLARTTVDRLRAGPDAPAWDAHVLGHDPERDLNRSRFYPNNVLLPDGGGVIVGGGIGADYRSPSSAGNYYLGDPAPPDGQEFAGSAAERRQVELRRPGERTWRLGAAQQEWRTYHSTAWLLPDGRIASSGDDGYPKLTGTRDNVEIYWPPYLFNGDECAPRPAIRGVGAPGPPSASARQWATLTYGEAFGIFSEHAEGGMQAVLVAPAATTHAADMNQRVVPLLVDATVVGGGLNVRMPPTASIAPPGYYMLFVVAADGTPSEARWVHVLAPGEAAAERSGVTPALVTGARADPQPRTCGEQPVPTASDADPATAPGAPAPGGVDAPGRAAMVKFPAKLALARAAIHRASRELDLLAPISALASGRVNLELHAAGRRTRTSAAIQARKRRISLKRRIPAAQAALGTGILTLTYKGNAATFPQTVRLRAAQRPARLVVRRPTLSSAGRLRASGTVDRRARGVVRVQLQFGNAGGVRSLEFTAKIEDSAWTLNTQLSRRQREALSARNGTVHSTVLFTGYAAARMRGEMRSYQVLGAP